MSHQEQRRDGEKQNLILARMETLHSWQRRLSTRTEDHSAVLGSELW